MTNVYFLEFFLLAGSYSCGTIARETQKVRDAAPVSHALTSCRPSLPFREELGGAEAGAAQ